MKNSLAVFAGIALAFLSLLLLEVLAWQFLHQGKTFALSVEQAPKTQNTKVQQRYREIVGPIQFDDGWVDAQEGDLDFSELNHSGLQCPDSLCPGLKVTSRLKTNSGKDMYNVTYSIDELGRRKTLNFNQDKASKFALFIGCSFVFGQGVEDDQTLPSQFSKERNEFQSINLGFPGFGPNDHFYRLSKSHKQISDIHFSDGIVIYLDIPAHIHRLFASTSRIQHDFILDKPYYSLDGQELTHHGTFRRHRWLTNWIYLGFSKSAIFQLLGMELPVFTEYHSALYAKTMQAILEQLSSQLPEHRAFFVMYPRQHGFNQILKEKVSALGNWTVIDLSDLDLNDLLHGRHLYPVDWHPTKYAYRAIAKVLAQEID